MTQVSLACVLLLNQLFLPPAHAKQCIKYEVQCEGVVAGAGPCARLSCRAKLAKLLTALYVAGAGQWPGCRERALRDGVRARIRVRGHSLVAVSYHNGAEAIATAPG